MIELFERAKKDIELAKHLLADEVYWDYCCFFCHQAVEKALKYVIASMGEGCPDIHDLQFLFNLCIEKESDFGDWTDLAIFLNPFYYEMVSPTGPYPPLSQNLVFKATEGTENLLKFMEELSERRRSQNEGNQNP